MDIGTPQPNSSSRFSKTVLTIAIVGGLVGSMSAAMTASIFDDIVDWFGGDETVEEVNHNAASDEDGGFWDWLFGGSDDVVTEQDVSDSCGEGLVCIPGFFGGESIPVVTDSSAKAITITTVTDTDNDGRVDDETLMEIEVTVEAVEDVEMTGDAEDGDESINVNTHTAGGDDEDIDLTGGDRGNEEDTDMGHGAAGDEDDKKKDDNDLDDEDIDLGGHGTDDQKDKKNEEEMDFSADWGHNSAGEEVDLQGFNNIIQIEENINLQ